MRWQTLYVTYYNVVWQKDKTRFNRNSELQEIKMKCKGFWMLLLPCLCFSFGEKLADHPNGTSKGNILIFHHFGTGSHVIALSALAEGLSEHGYNVTTVLWKKAGNNTTNYHQLVVTDRHGDEKYLSQNKRYIVMITFLYKQVQDIF